jgi:hypothetical protein
LPHFSSIPEKLLQLIIKLANEADDKTYTKILDTLLDVEIKEYNIFQGQSSLHSTSIPKTEKYVVTKIPYYTYEEIIKELLHKPLEKVPFQLVDILIRKLSKAIKLECIIKKGRNVEDGNLSFWRYAIEYHKQNPDDREVKSLLVTALRDTLEDIAVHDFKILRRCMKRVARETHKIFRRIELHIYRKFPINFRKEINKAIFKYIDDIEIYHEYYLLIKQAFKSLPKPIQEKYLKTISKGPNLKSLKSSRLGKRRKELNQQETERYKKRWKVHRLEPIEDFLSNSMRRSYNKMVKEAGGKSFNGFLFYSNIVSDSLEYGPSQLTENMKPSEVLSYIQTYNPKGDKADVFEDATALKFQELVKTKSLEYSELTNKMTNIHPIFCYRFFNGINQAITENQPINWNGILSLCENFVNPDNIRKNPPFLYDIFIPVAQLFDFAFANEKIWPPFNERKRIWNVISTLIQHSNGDTSWDLKYPSSTVMDAFNISMNTTRGIALADAINYARWHNHTYNLSHNKRKKIGLAKKVKMLLERHLNPDIDNSISTRAVFGYFLPSLFDIDKEWTKKIYLKSSLQMSKINYIMQHGTLIFVTILFLLIWWN